MINPEKFRPPHFALLFLTGAIILHFGIKPARLVHSPYHLLGILIVLIGVGLMTWAYKCFSYHGTPVAHCEKPSTLVIEGPFQFSRNPMYVGGGFIFLGIAFIVGTWPFLLIWVLMGIVLDQIYIPWEENRMVDLFGREFLKYRSQTRKWI